MPVQISCPNPTCGKALIVAESQVGTSVRCRFCNQVFTAARPAAVTGLACPAVTATLAPVAASTDPVPPATLSPSINRKLPLRCRLPTVPVTGLPQRIGRFVIKQRLGEGAFGVVYRAYDSQTYRDVALKVAKPDALKTPQRVERFKREGKAAGNLRHPNIVPLFETGRTSLSPPLRGRA